MAEVSAETVRSISTPDKVESRLGTLEFNDGAPSESTAAMLYDHLDFMHGVEAFLGALPGASLAAVRRGFLSMGAEDNSFTLFPELMDSASVFLTGNCDTIYYWGFLDLTDGPMVLDVPSIDPPSGILGTIDDMWFRWVTDFGLPGPDRGRGGRYLMVGPNYDGPLPDSGFHVFHARTTRVTVIGRAFMINNDPRLPTEAIRNGVRVSRYVPGAQGTAVATFLSGNAPLGAASEAPETRFVDSSGKSFNTVYPNDFGFWELVHELVQQEPPSAADPDLLGLLASVGIVHGKPFEPDTRMRKILEDAVVVGNATARTVTFAPRPEEGFAFYPNSAWSERPLRWWLPVPRPAPADHRRRPSRRPERRCPQTQFPHQLLVHGHWHHTSDVHAPHRDRLAVHLRHARQRRRVLRWRPQLSPHAATRYPRKPLWSVILYDRQTRSMLQTDQHLPRLGSQSGTVEANPDGSTDIYFGPTAPEGKADNWLQTVPGKGWWTILRLYSPEASFLRQDLAAQRDRTDLRHEPVWTEGGLALCAEQADRRRSFHCFVA